jgi:MOSC domain-containing protein
MHMAKLARITIYPVKALPGVEVQQATFGERGGLCHDREYALRDQRGNFINGKRNAGIHRLDASCEVRGDEIVVAIGQGSDTQTFVLGNRKDLHADCTALEARLAHDLGETVRLERDAAGGFPDDLESPGPTVISTATLQEVAGWYPGLDAQDMRRRFRANLEIDRCPAFWEDRLYGGTGSVVAFRIGEVRLLGNNPCLRCVVPTRDPSTGDEIAGFQRTFAARRRETLPSWANRARFDFFYRLSVNTRIEAGETGKTIRIGDPVEISHAIPI